MSQRPIMPGSSVFQDRMRRMPSTPMDESSQIQQAYQMFLGRQASPDELQGWLSGSYGYGQSGNLGPIFDAIRQSAEAQQRPPVNMPMPVPMGGGDFKPSPVGLPPGAEMGAPSMRAFADQARKYRAQGEAAGQDMSWMDQQGALAGPQGFRGPMSELPPRQPRQAQPLGAQNMDRMRKAILGVPEY